MSYDASKEARRLWDRGLDEREEFRASIQRALQRAHDAGQATEREAVEGLREALQPFADAATLTHIEAEPDVGVEEFWMCGGCGIAYGKAGVCDDAECMWANARRALASFSTGEAAGPPTVPLCWACQNFKLYPASGDYAPCSRCGKPTPQRAPAAPSGRTR